VLCGYILRTAQCTTGSMCYDMTITTAEQSLVATVAVSDRHGDTACCMQAMSLDGIQVDARKHAITHSRTHTVQG
jgi:hypothetical protein